MNRRKIIGASLFFSLFGLMAIMPPLVLLFRFDALIFGVPVEVVYFFGLWVFLVVGACGFGALLPPEDDSAPRRRDAEP